MLQAASVFLGTIAILVFALLRSPTVRRQELMVAAGFALYIVVGWQISFWLIGHSPITIDPQLLAIDRFMGLDPRHAILQRQHHWILWVTFYLIYESLSLIMGITWAIDRNQRFVLAISLGGGLCFLFYALFPAVGPAWYNWQQGAASYMPRNCIPSMHFTWALLMAWNSRHSLHLVLRYGLWLYLAMIAIATIVMGQHYYIDLLVAVPYAAALQYLSVIILRGYLGRILRYGSQSTLPATSRC